MCGRFASYKNLNKLKNICFLNFHSNYDSSKAFEILKNQRFENCILCVEWADY